MFCLYTWTTCGRKDLEITIVLFVNYLTFIMTDFKAHESLLAELYQTLTSLAVRNEFCQEIMDLGGVKLMIETIGHNPDNQVRALTFRLHLLLV